MRNGSGRVVLVKRMGIPKEAIVGVVSPICTEMVFAHVPGNSPVPKVGDEVVLIVHPRTRRLTANRMEAV